MIIYHRIEPNMISNLKDQKSKAIKFKFLIKTQMHPYKLLKMISTAQKSFKNLNIKSQLIGSKILISKRNSTTSRNKSGLNLTITFLKLFKPKKRLSITKTNTKTFPKCHKKSKNNRKTAGIYKDR
jgi:hypothetical protein